MRVILPAAIGVVMLLPSFALVAIAQEKGGPAATPITVIDTNEAPASVGPYSQAMRAGGFIFCAGQAAFDPATGRLVEGGIREQTRQAGGRRDH